MSEEIKVWELDNHVYIENWTPITEEEVSLEIEEIQKQDGRGRDYKPYSLRMWTKIKIELHNESKKKVMEALFSEYNVKDMLHHGRGEIYDYRGRTTDKSKEEADEKAKRKVIEKVNDFDLEEKLEEINKRIQSSIEDNNRRYVESIVSRAGRRDNFPWDEWDDGRLNEARVRLNEINHAINRLEQRRHKIKKMKVEKENELFLENFDGFDDVAPEANEAIRSEAEERELFNIQTRNLHF